MAISKLFSWQSAQPQVPPQPTGAGADPAVQEAPVTMQRDVFQRSVMYRPSSLAITPPTPADANAIDDLADLKAAVEQADAALKAKAEPPKPAEPPAPAPAPEPAPAPPPPPPAPTYTVASGDSLSAIAERTLGNGDRWHEIFDLNRDQIADPNQINVGQVLKLPNGANSAPAPAPAPAPANGRNSDRGQIYIHQPNGWTCGPTSLTMAAAAFGVKPLGVGTVNELTGMTHTTPEYGVPDNTQLPNAARQIGLQATDSRDSSPQAVREALQNGHGVILNGSLGTGGHFIYVAGLNPDGSFIICDPWRPEVTAMNDGDLNHFAHNNPGHGGMIEVWR
jgi:hypothetical protein